jgi:dTDP-4-amino-4,6-dideoxygalactose transaminase
MRVHFQRPQLPPATDIEHYFQLSREARWFSNDGPCARLLSERLSERLGLGVECVPVASGTAALMVALRALTEQASPASREVVVPSFTYIATVSAIVWSGFVPVFVDVDPEHWHVDPASLRAAVDQRGSSLACLLPCSTFGTAPPAKVRRGWEEVAREAGLPVLVDSAAGFGSLDEEGQPLGRQGDAEIFSFHATKPFGVGEGGAVVTREPELADRVRQLVQFGLDASRSLPGVPGLNAKMSEIHAATGLAVLDGYEHVLAARRERAAEIAARLSPRGFAFQQLSAGSTWQFVPVLAPDPSTRDAILRRGQEVGVELRTYHEALHLMEQLREHPVVGSLEVTVDLAARILSLPMANDLDAQSVDLVCDCVAGAVEV